MDWLGKYSSPALRARAEDGASILVRRVRRAHLWILCLTLLLLLLPMSTPNALGQGERGGGWVWSRFWSLGYGGAAVVDNSGVYVIGLDTDSHWSALRKFTSGGEPQWVRTLSSINIAYHILAIHASDLYVIGQSTGDRDVFIHQYTPDGEPVWSHRFGGDWVDFPRDAAVDATGVYVVGDSWVGGPASAYRDSFLVKFDHNGSERWRTRFESPGTEFSGMAVGLSGVYIVGDQQDRPTLWKFDLDGALEWGQRIEGDVAQVAAVAVGRDDIYVVGTTTEFRSDPRSRSETDAFLRSYDAGGTENWTRQFGAPGFPGTPASDRATGVAVEAWGVYVAGEIHRGTPGPHDVFARRFARDGAELWGVRYVGASDARGFAVGPSGVYLTGTSEGRAYVARFAETPEAPRDVLASPGEGQVGLEWQPPRFDGGMPILAYQIYRGTEPGILLPLALVTAPTLSYVDGSAANHVTQHYAVAAVNLMGEGLWSPAVEATPGSPPAVVNPAPPPIDPILAGVIAVLGATVILAVYWLRGVGKPGDDRVPSGGLRRTAQSGLAMRRIGDGTLFSLRTLGLHS